MLCKCKASDVNFMWISVMKEMLHPCYLFSSTAGCNKTDCLGQLDN